MSFQICCDDLETDICNNQKLLNHPFLLSLNLTLKV